MAKMCTGFTSQDREDDPKAALVLMQTALMRLASELCALT